MSPLRLFIAVELPSSIQDSIQKRTAGLREALGTALVRWLPLQNVHLTLKFLGDVAPQQLEALQDLLVRQAVHEQGFDVEVGGLGAYPSVHRPSIVWIGLRAPDGLRSLQHGIEAAAEGLGFRTEQRRFSPHLTIGRVNPRASANDLRTIRAALESAELDGVGSLSVRAIHLFRSELQPIGSIYTKLFSTALGSATQAE
jgi:2'-5' RNA ligase